MRSLGSWRSFTAVQQHRLPIPLLGSALLPILADGPPAILAPLPAGAFGIDAGSRGADRIHLQLPADQGRASGGGRPDGQDQDASVHHGQGADGPAVIHRGLERDGGDPGGDDLRVRLLCAVDVRHAGAGCGGGERAEVAVVRPALCKINRRWTLH